MLCAVDAVAAKLEEDWKYENLLDHDGEWVSAVTVPIASLKDWLNVVKNAWFRFGHTADGDGTDIPGRCGSICITLGHQNSFRLRWGRPTCHGP